MKNCSFNQQSQYLSLVIAWAFLIIFIPLTAFADNQIYLIDLKYRSSNDIVNAIAPLLPQSTTIKQFENKILLNTDPETYASIKAIVTELDVMPVQLRITLYHGNTAPANVAGIGENNQTDLKAGSLDGNTRYIRSTSRETERKTDEILVQSGEVAFVKTDVTLPLLNHQYAYQDRSQAQRNLNQKATSISTNQELTLPAELGTKIIIPTPSTTADDENDGTLLSIENPTTTDLPINIPATPGADFTLKNANSNSSSSTVAEGNFQANRGASAQSYEYHQLNSGLHVRPIYTPGSDKVILEILSVNTTIEQPNQMNDKAYSQYQINSKMMIPLNEWVYIGGNRLDKMDATSYEYRTSSHEKNNQHLWVYIKKSN